MYIYIYIYIHVYIYVYMYIYIYIYIYTYYAHARVSAGALMGMATSGGWAALATLAREFRDVVFEDVVFDNNSSVTPY